jgi:hypothetical protein
MAKELPKSAADIDTEPGDKDKRHNNGSLYLLITFTGAK